MKKGWGGEWAFYGQSVGCPYGPDCDSYKAQKECLQKRKKKKRRTTWLPHFLPAGTARPTAVKTGRNLVQNDFLVKVIIVQLTQLLKIQIEKKKKV